MRKYVKYIILIVAVVVCFLGVKLLYDRLSEDYKPENGLVVENSEAGNIVAEGTDTQASTEDVSTDAQQVSSQATTEEQSDSTEYSKAIDFTVEDIAGNKISLYSKIGKPIVVNFWASWCSPCKSELPDFQLAYEEYGDEIEFMMVNLTDGRSETVEGASGYVNSQGYTFPVYYDVDQEAALAYYIMSIPTTYFIDAEGNIIAYAQGMIDYDTLVQGIGMIK